MRIVCWQTILMKYHALFVIFEKAAKFIELKFDTISTLIWQSQHWFDSSNIDLKQFLHGFDIVATFDLLYCFNIGLTLFPKLFSICWKYAIIGVDITSFSAH